MPLLPGESLATFEARLIAEAEAEAAARARPKHVSQMSDAELRTFEAAHGLHAPWRSASGGDFVPGMRRAHAVVPGESARDMSPAELREFERAHRIF